MKTEVQPKFKERSAAIFLHSMADGYITSFSANQLPLGILDKSLSGKIDPSHSILTVKRDNWEITYRAAAIQDPKTNESDYYFATSSAMLVLDTIWELINEGKCHLKQQGNTFSVMFRKAELRRHLAENGKSRNGRQINEQLKILQHASLEVKNTAVGGDRISLTGNYLQSAYEVESDDPKYDGLYLATLHPIIAQDLMDCRWRDFPKTFLAGSSENNALHRTLIHRMRHKFTNADATAECISHTFWMGDLLFSSGKVEPMSQAAMRKAINTLRSKLIASEIISDRDKLESSWELDSVRGVQDYLITITPTTVWGESQRKSNAKYKKQLEMLTQKEANILIEEFDIKPTSNTVIHKVS
ncbi:hypothetical protein [Photobacterium damselae]|uniref:hypothetical protein n=1 Tax=Photobacterium damselae TaxID=38293 RepID=UPI004069645B